MEATKGRLSQRPKVHASARRPRVVNPFGRIRRRGGVEAERPSKEGPRDKFAATFQVEKKVPRCMALAVFAPPG